MAEERKIFVTHLNIRQSIFLLLLKLVVVDVLATLLILFYFSSLYLPQVSIEVKLQIISSNIYYFLLLAAIKMFLTVFVVLQWLNEYYEITSTKIIHKKGIIWRKEEEYELTHVRSIGIQQSLLGRIFNFGILDFYDWRLQKYIYVYLIHNPKKYHHILEELLPRINREREIVREHLREEE